MLDYWVKLSAGSTVALSLSAPFLLLLLTIYTICISLPPSFTFFVSTYRGSGPLNAPILHLKQEKRSKPLIRQWQLHWPQSRRFLCRKNHWTTAKKDFTSLQTAGEPGDGRINPPPWILLAVFFFFFWLAVREPPSSRHPGRRQSDPDEGSNRSHLHHLVSSALCCALLIRRWDRPANGCKWWAIFCAISRPAAPS